MAARRFKDYTANVRIGAKCLCHRCQVIRWNNHGLLRDLGRHSGNGVSVRWTVGAGDDRIVPAVEMAGQLEDMRFAGVDACQT